MNTFFAAVQIAQTADRARLARDEAYRLAVVHALAGDPMEQRGGPEAVSGAPRAVSAT